MTQSRVAPFFPKWESREEVDANKLKLLEEGSEGLSRAERPSERDSRELHKAGFRVLRKMRPKDFAFVEAMGCAREAFMKALAAVAELAPEELGRIRGEFVARWLPRIKEELGRTTEERGKRGFFPSDPGVAKSLVGVPLETLDAMLRELGHPDEFYVQDLMKGTIGVGAMRRDGILEPVEVGSEPGGEPSLEARQKEKELLEQAMTHRNAAAVASLPDPTPECDPTGGTLKELLKGYFLDDGFYEMPAGGSGIPQPVGVWLHTSDGGKRYVPPPAPKWRFEQFLLTPRFVFLQEKADGSMKERMVDNAKFSGLNDLLEVAMKIRYDSRRDLEASRKALLALGLTPRYVTHDVTAAYKMLAHSEGQLRLAPVAVRVMCSDTEHGEPRPKTLVFTPTRAIFGGVYSVHAWHRTGGVLQAIAQRGLLIPLLRYVDDVFRVATDETLVSDRESLEVIAAALGYPLAKSNLEGFKGEAAVEAGLRAEVLGAELRIEGEVGVERAAKAGVYAAMCRRLAARIREGGVAVLREPAVQLALRQVAGLNEWAAYSIYGRPAKAMNRHVYRAASRKPPKGTAVAPLPPSGVADILEWYAGKVYGGPPVRVDAQEGRHLVVFTDACSDQCGIGAVVYDPA